MTMYLAGGTDLMERRRSGVSTGPLTLIPEHAGMRAVNGARVGALVTIDTVATALSASHPALAVAAGALATPQIRRIATIGGNLLQHNRCWYYRHPDVDCFKKGGSTCPARAGNHRFGALFDLGPCVAVHPSTLGAALLTYDATVDTDRRTALTLPELFGDGSDPHGHHRLAEGEVLTAINLPAPVPGERAGYFRAIGRAYAEWPLAEASVRLGLDGGRIAWVAVGVGGVAPVPLRLTQVEQALVGREPAPDVLAAAAQRSCDGANPLPFTGYKLSMLVGTVLETLERALA